MVHLFLWLITFPSILYHISILLILVLGFLYHKARHCLFKSSKSSARVIHYQEYLKSKRISLIKMCKKSLANANESQTVSSVKSILSMGNKNSHSSCRASLMAILMIVLISIQFQGNILCLEEDANLMKPFAEVAKSLISAATLGVPQPIEISSTQLIRSLVKFSWRTGFPVTMPRNFLDEGTAFYNNMIERISKTSVDNLSRKRLASLKVDLDNIVDSLVEHVRQHPRGLYSDWLETRVGNVTLEEAVYNVGLQFKGYAIDIANYRNIAGAVLGVPIVPTVASHVVNAGKLAAPIAQLPGAALGTMTSLSGSALSTISNSITTPFRSNMNQIQAPAYEVQAPIQDLIPPAEP